ncbi:hypothetical protein G7059_09805 [Erysipelothrix sp. HDW6A]|uniref:hypothetical protein n=1 Tax=Erysipelothrix sp. HDW6A TaxID=2714928 RepID=UPI001407ECF9|nr:hypothetical protein [Erysipelothrix sp. HDW6A]QIK58116.1 hypothetical protein G7059_09805 [Erysipelothrix sp. HDW6A]
MKIAVIRHSYKDGERRVPIHPKFLDDINEDVLRNLIFEKDYGMYFGVDDEVLESYTGNACLPKDVLLRECDKVIITKPTYQDIEMMKDGATLFGWIHSVQNKELVDLALEKKLSYVAWENMYYETKRGRVHIFQTNNELAGYCGVQHALQQIGVDGYYGPQRKIKIVSFGSVSRGAIHALMSQGFYDIEVYSWRPSHLIADQIHAITYSQMYFDENHILRVDKPGKPRIVDEFAASDVIVNGILQNPNKPVMYFYEDDIHLFKNNTLIIDISCDEGMGFPFAQATSFEEPILKFGKIQYYAVDHIPTLLWDSASYQISKSLKPYLYQFVYDNYGEVLENAIDIKDGKIVNKRIIEFQNR